MKKIHGYEKIANLPFSVPTNSDTFGIISDLIDISSKVAQLLVYSDYGSIVQLKMLFKLHLQLMHLISKMDNFKATFKHRTRHFLDSI